eukprot:1096130-Pleurochrysis_carterae.AAC.1
MDVQVVVNAESLQMLRSDGGMQHAELRSEQSAVRQVAVMAGEHKSCRPAAPAALLVRSATLCVRYRIRAAQTKQRAWYGSAAAVT